MSDRDLLDIIDTLKTLQIQQQQVIERQQELTSPSSWITSWRVTGEIRLTPIVSAPYHLTHPIRQTPIVTVLPHPSFLVEFHQLSDTLLQLDHSTLHLLPVHQHVGVLLFLGNKSTSPMYYSFNYTRPVGSGHHCDTGVSTMDRFSHIVQT